jgi:hypothetical protein
MDSGGKEPSGDEGVGGWNGQGMASVSESEGSEVDGEHLGGQWSLVDQDGNEFRRI